jgi:pyocin large subunit-like protein
LADRKLLAGALLAALALSACERGGAAQQAAREEPAEVASPDAADATDARQTSAPTPSASARAERDDPRDGPQPQHDTGGPVWAANSRYTAEEAAQRQFERNGEVFGADTVEEYVDQAHAFIDKPPAGVERATRSRNGDQLMYDPKSNTFAVATRDGAPRTMFKPDDGAAYWAEQKQQAAGGRSARNRDNDDRG